MPTTARFGTWKSPITTDAIVSQNISFTELRSDGTDLYWLEARPKEGGRCVIVKRSSSGKTIDLIPSPYNVRSRVHEYGGGAYCVEEGVAYFSHFADQRIYRADEKGVAPLTPEGPFRYADAVVDMKHQRLICVREDHSTSDQDAQNTLAAIPLTGGSTGVVLSKGYDFYTAPRLSPDGKRLAWISWNHPNMPWDGTELWIADIGADGSLQSKKRVAGGKEEAVFQPEFGSEGSLYFVSDRTGWGNLYRTSPDLKKTECLFETKYDFSLPYWQFGMRTYCLISDNDLFCGFCDKGIWKIGRLDTESKQLKEIPSPYTELSFPNCAPNSVFFEGAASDRAFELVLYDLSTEKFEVLKSSTKEKISSDYISQAQTIEFETEGKRTAFGFYYPPKNADYKGPAGELPPLLVKTHGGPTAAASSALSLKTQFWTSRGFAVLDVNYGGSTGFGRAYMKRLEKNWGVVDVADCVNGAMDLVKKGLVDKNRLAIFGGSAGGYTTLAALAFTDTFRAGASYYGVGDLEALVRDTHKFESRYPDRLIGPYPERKDLYFDRSPINHVEQFSCPIIFFQGLEDKIVPPNQTESMVEALKGKGISVEYVPFEGEQHGFRRAENIKTSLERELSFYQRVFGLVV